MRSRLIHRLVGKRAERMKKIVEMGGREVRRDYFVRLCMWCMHVCVCVCVEYVAEYHPLNGDKNKMGIKS